MYPRFDGLVELLQLVKLSDKYRIIIVVSIILILIPNCLLFSFFMFLDLFSNKLFFPDQLCISRFLFYGVFVNFVFVSKSDFIYFF